MTPVFLVKSIQKLYTFDTVEHVHDESIQINFILFVE